MNNTVNFSIQQTKNTMQALNTNRRDIMNACYKIMTIYNSYDLNSWCGQTRKNYHLKMFGSDNQTGRIGAVLDICTGPLNELLYSLANHIIYMIQADNNGVSNLSPEDFTGDRAVSKADVNIAYDQIDTNVIRVPKDNFSSFKAETISAYQNGINGCIELFNGCLNQLRNSIEDESISQIEAQTRELNEISQEIGRIISELLNEIETFGNKAQSSINTVVQEQQKVTNEMAASKFVD